uniref:Uncharacterized protein n=1 Tax=Trichobilharzia regenti TaxID=157069 RepID=A0AA85IY50_TRIRE|nr:unnamed protein product [Trichobilharzia regenti]
MSCAVDIYDSAPHFQWITRGNGGGVGTTPVSVGKAQLLDSMRFTIQDLVQQESCIGSSNYPVDKPSRLVQIECRKPGCRCVLKNERALAMKIVPGVTLVQGEWLLPNNVAGKSNWSQTSQHMTNPLSNNKSSSCCSSQNDVNGSQFGSACSQSVVLTSCCPSWFELVRRSVIGPTDTGSQICPEVPVWSSCKAVWRAKPKFILLRKETQCLFATNAQSLIMSSADLLKKDDRTTLTLDADNIGLLRPGTVLQLIDCRLCRLIHKDDQTTASSSSYRFSSRYRSKPVSMLQCSVVGGKALAALAASITNLSPQDALNWFSTGPRLVYLSLASKSIMCSPVNISNCSSVNTVNTAKHSSHTDQSITDNHNYSNNNGVHSILSLLSTYQLPIITRPVVGLRSSEWFFMGRLTNQAMISNSDSVNMHSLLQIFSCHHGDLIFLEPLSDCTGSIYQNESNMSGKSRFFVVTTDMLMQHYFLVADSPTCALYSRELETHAFRVSHFLAACHPVQGLTYILKHLEDISHSSNTGPSYTPLTRTLGPITNRFGTIAIQSAVTSIAAIASLAMHEEHNDIPNDPYHQLNEIQPKILNYLSLNSTTTTVIGALSSSSSPQIDNIDFYHSTNCLNTHLYNTHSSLSSSIFASETDEMNALCDEIEDIYFYVRNGHFPMHSHSLSSLHQRHEEKSLNASAPISPYLNKLQSINQYNSNKKINNNNSYNPVLIEHEIRNNNSNNNNNNCPVKITSKAPVLLIRPKPYENCSTSGDGIKQFTSTSIQQPPPAQSWNQLNVNYSTGHNNSYYPHYQQSKELNFTPKPWQPITNDQSSRCHVKSRPMVNNNANNKSNVFPNTSTTSATSTSAKINNNNNSGNSMAFINLTPSSVHQCNHSVSVTSSTSLTSSYEYGASRPPPPTTTTTTSRTAQHFIQTIPPKLYINNNENGVASMHKSNHLIQQSMYSSNLPAVTLSTCNGNQLTRPLFMTTSTSMLDKQNCARYTNENPNYSEECIYDEPKEVNYSTQPYKITTVTAANDYSRGNKMPAFTTTNDISYYPPIPRQSISSPSQNRRHLSLSTSHLYPSVSMNSTTNQPVYESDMSFLDGNICCPTITTSHLIIGGLTTPNTTTMTKDINHRSTTAFHSINNLSNDDGMTTSMINRIKIIPRMGDSSNYTTALPNNNTNNSSHETHYFPTNTADSSNCMTTSSNSQLHQEQPPPPSMPLLYNIPSVRTPRTPSRTSRLYQSTILPSSTSNDQKQQVSFVHRPYPFIRSSNKQINSGCYDPSALSNTALLQSPRHKSTELTNSSPDTGIGVESNYDQQITSGGGCGGGGGGGCFMPLNAYHHHNHHSSSSSTNLMMPKIVWSPIVESNSLQQRQDSETCVKTSISGSSSNYENQSGKQSISCKLTRLFVNNAYLNNTIGTTNTSTTTTTTAITNHNNKSARNQPLYRF